MDHNQREIRRGVPTCDPRRRIKKKMEVDISEQVWNGQVQRCVKFQDCFPKVSEVSKVLGTFLGDRLERPSKAPAL